MPAREQQTVVDVLADLPSWDVHQARVWETEIKMGADNLDYEAVAHPLKLTGGQVCLQWRDHTADRSGYVCWHPDGLVYRFDDGDRLTGAHAAGALQYDLDSPSVQLSPILRERTPFDESEHD